jgi:pimeloyl-ACP methyl ester carboxylesterase
MEIVRSADGTKIAYDKLGEGPAVVLVDGAMCIRSSGAKPELTRLLASDFTVYSYDRRGRGDSGDTLPYAVDREIDDIAALIEAAGGTACLFGHSSGASLAMEAAAALDAAVTKLAMYEAPYDDDPAVGPRWRQYLADLAQALAAGRRGDAAAFFMRYVGVPEQQIDAMHDSPGWAAIEAVAPSLSYDHAGVIGQDASVPAELAARVKVPTLVLYGDASFPFMRETAKTLSRLIPHAELRALAGQTHDVNPAVMTPVLTAFFAS